MLCVKKDGLLPGSFQVPPRSPSLWEHPKLLDGALPPMR